MFLFRCMYLRFFFFGYYRGILRFFLGNVVVVIKLCWRFVSRSSEKFEGVGTFTFIVVWVVLRSVLVLVFVVVVGVFGGLWRVYLDLYV